MPAYDFRCKECQRPFTLTYASYAERDQAVPKCVHCGSANLTRVIRRVAVLTGDEARMERLADPSRLAGIEEDPRAMGRLMHEMAAETGEDVGPELHEVASRLEAGESPESIEASMPSLDAGSSSADNLTD